MRPTWQKKPPSKVRHIPRANSWLCKDPVRTFGLQGWLVGPEATHKHLLVSLLLLLLVAHKHNASRQIAQLAGAPTSGDSDSV